MPGTITPPRYSPRAEITSKCGRRAEIHDDARAAVFSKGRDAVDDAVRADFLRIVDEDGHARLDARLDEQRLAAEIALGHACERGIQRRHDRADDHAADFAGSSPASVKRSRVRMPYSSMV